MSSTINFHVRGLSVCFYKNATWNIFFPCDAEHKVDISGPNIPAGTNLWGTNSHRDFDVVSSGVITNGPPSVPGNGSLLNLAEFHGISSATRSNLKLDTNNISRSDSYVWLKLPGATMYVSAVNSKHYWIQEIDANEQPKGPRFSRRGIASQLTFSFDVISNIELRVKEGTGVKHSFQLGIGNLGETFDYFLSNDCNRTCVGNDFKDIYKYFSDTRTPGRRFLAGKETFLSHTLVMSERADEDKTVLDARGADLKFFFSVQGNCDPVGDDPPPQP